LFNIGEGIYNSKLFKITNFELLLYTVYNIKIATVYNDLLKVYLSRSFFQVNSKTERSYEQRC